MYQYTMRNRSGNGWSIEELLDRAMKSNGQTIHGDGTGQTIAIVDVDQNRYLGKELYAFDRNSICPTPR